MDHVVFCPDESMIEEASKLARSWMLPILNGHSKRTETLDFDDSQVTLLSIPIEKYVDYSPKIGTNELFVFIFVDWICFLFPRYRLYLSALIDYPAALFFHFCPLNSFYLLMQRSDSFKEIYYLTVENCCCEGI